MEEETLQHYRAALTSSANLGVETSLDARGRALLERIEQAFADWPANAGDTWVQGEMLDNREPDDVVKAGAQIGNYTRWQDVPPTLIAELPSAVGYLDDAGLNFYWPALMVWELRYGPTYEPGSPAERLDAWSSRLRPQTPEQARVFEEYRQYIRERHG